MDTSAARAMAIALMVEHGLADWRLVLDGARTRAGVCRPARREIGLSRVLTALHTPEQVRDTVLHEIAHALVGVGHGHDAVWRAKAVEIGGTGTRCVPETAARADTPWKGTCPDGHVVGRHRRPTRVQSCRRCTRGFDPAALLRWTWHGRTVPMHPRYVAELAELGGWRLLQQRTGGSRPDAGPVPGETVAAAASAARQPDAGPGTVGAPATATGTLRPGTVVQVGGRGRYAGTVGVVQKRARTRYHVRTEHGLLTVPFALVRRL